ncbi:ABC transporter permease [Aquipuribacter nitratireducens]|uniref:ABC transporter permease n=1 Tax=Aquipuribacter nitratireducens TaxID=650104 RepID=A0ABW0GLG4_9MICO
MGVFIARRVIISFFTLLAATFVVYVLVANSGDPLEELYPIPNESQREAAIAGRIELLGLDQPVLQRYLGWLAGAAGCLVGACDLGQSITQQPVTDLLSLAVLSTLRLVTAATVLAVIFGVTIGIISALRQYTGFDYTVTFVAFLFFSLPIFWVAVLLKEFGAIRLNDWLADPGIPLTVTIALAAFAALFWQAVFGGRPRRRLTVAAVAAAATAAVLVYLDAVEWFARPALGPVLVVLISLGWAVGITFLVSGIRNRRVLFASLAAAGGGLVGAMLLAGPLRDPSWLLIFACTLGLVAVGVVAGVLLGGLDRPQAIRAGVLTALLTGGTVFTDYVLAAFSAYYDRVNGRVIKTIGSGTPNFDGTFWEVWLDRSTSLILPTAALILISFATYTRYTRASMLEVLNMDYVRTARAKGLTERTVTVRHAFRNALIPVTTLAAVDFGSVIGGAVITETVFGWSGMGRLFVDGLRNVDPNPVMGFFVVTAVLVVVFNLVADILYAYLDPRIRLS